MHNHERDSINEMDFDMMLENSIPDIPPDDVVKEVTPWSKAMSRVIIGIVLSTLTLNFGGLNYILPVIGVILCLLGFMALRKENLWFKSCWVIALLQVADLLPRLILNATIVQRTMSTSIVFSVLNILSTFLLMFFLWRGLIAVKRKTNLPANARSAAALLIWYISLFIIAILQYVGWFYWIMIIFYIGIIYNLFKLSEELDEAGYAIKPVAVRVPDWAIVTGILTVLVVGITCGYLFFNSYPMDWELEEEANDAEIKEIKEELIELGFPEGILEDLTDEDIKACEGAVRVVVEEDRYPVNDGRDVEEKRGDHTYTTTVYDVEELQITAIAVELSGDNEQWKIFHHFLWTVAPGFYGTESIQLWSADSNKDGWKSTGDLSGHILYDMDGQSYIAPYYSLGSETYGSNNIMNILMNGQSATDVFATFSMPDDGENHRGYLSYTVKREYNGCVLYSQINYTHQRSWLQYPVKTAVENQMYDGWNSDSAFKTVQNILTFHPDNEMIEE